MNVTCSLCDSKTFLEGCLQPNSFAITRDFAENSLFSRLSIVYSSCYIQLVSCKDERKKEKKTLELTIKLKI